MDSIFLRRFGGLVILVFMILLWIFSPIPWYVILILAIVSLYGFKVVFPESINVLQKLVDFFLLSFLYISMYLFYLPQVIELKNVADKGSLSHEFKKTDFHYRIGDWNNFVQRMTAFSSHCGYLPILRSDVLTIYFEFKNYDVESGEKISPVIQQCLTREEIKMSMREIFKEFGYQPMSQKKILDLPAENLSMMVHRQTTTTPVSNPQSLPAPTPRPALPPPASVPVSTPALISTPVQQTIVQEQHVQYGEEYEEEYEEYEEYEEDEEDDIMSNLMLQNRKK